MAEQQAAKAKAKPKVKKTEAKADFTAAATPVKLNGLYAFKMGMSSVYTEDGRMVPVTVLKYEPWIVSEVRTKDSHGYSAVQIACRPEKAKNGVKSKTGHLKKAGFENGARLVEEIRQEVPEGVAVGQRVDIESLAKGDVVRLISRSKGHGFAGCVKRWNFAGGPAAHGSKFHRRPGSVGNREWPGRVMPGKKFPGHFGDEKVTIGRVEVVGVLPEDGAVLVKGPVPGGRNTLVQLIKV